MIGRLKRVARRVLLGATALTLIGCEPLTLLPVTQMPVAGGAVTVAAPEGYCIDPKGTREQPMGTFVLLGNCSLMFLDLSGPAVPVVLTALISDPLQTQSPPTPTALAKYFKSTSGRASLARDRDPTSVQVLQSETRDGVLYMRFRDSSPERDAALTSESWRAMMPMGNRLTVLTAQGLSTRTVSSDTTLTTLRNFVAAVKAANAAPATP